MKSELDPTKLPFYRKEWSIKPKAVPERAFFPCRHVCGEIVQAEPTGEGALFYRRFDTDGKDVPLSVCLACSYPLTLDWMRPLYRINPMPYHLAVLTQAWKVCSNCWGILKISNKCIPIYDEGIGLKIDCRMVTCENCEYETIGYVTQRYVGWAREQDYLDYGRAITGLAEALELEQEGLPIDLKKTKRPVNELLTELGF